MRRFSHEYGAGPLHLLLVLASFAVAGWAVLQMLDLSAPDDFLIWFGAAIVAHDLVLLPLYSLVDSTASRLAGARIAVLNHLRAPAIVAGLLLILFFPLILGLADSGYMNASGLDTEPFLGRWLLLTGALFLLSGALLAMRLLRDRRRGSRQAEADSGPDLGGREPDAPAQGLHDRAGDR